MKQRSLRLRLVARGLGAVLAIFIAGNRAAGEAPVAKPALELRIEAQGWGDAGLRDVEAVLRSAAAELLAHVPGAEIEPIRVYPKGGPIVLYERSAAGEIVMKLNTGDRFWAQYAFQFGHEMCHILCKYNARNSGNKWFEESLCEAASLFVVRGMGQTWKTSPPYANWKSFAPNLTKYAQERAKEFSRPQEMTLAQWYRQNAQTLRKETTNRKLNGVAALAILPLLEKDPGHWAAVQWLNKGVTQEAQTFGQYLGAWKKNLPQRHQGFVEEIARLFEVPLDQ